MLPFVTPTSDTRADDVRVVRSDRTAAPSAWGGFLVLAVIAAAIILALVLAGSGGSDPAPLEPTPTGQQ